MTASFKLYLCMAQQIRIHIDKRSRREIDPDDSCRTSPGVLFSRERAGYYAMGNVTVVRTRWRMRGENAIRWSPGN